MSRFASRHGWEGNVHAFRKVGRAVTWRYHWVSVAAAGWMACSEFFRGRRSAIWQEGEACGPLAQFGGAGWWVNRVDVTIVRATKYPRNAVRDRRMVAGY